MAKNKRIFFATRKAGIAPDGSNNFTTLRGVQTIGGSLTFELDNIQEIGQIETYEIDEDIPAVELTTEKVLDGHPPIYTLATQDGVDATLVGRAKTQCALAISIYEDTVESATGAASQEVQSSGLFVSSLSYTVTTDGSATESMTLIGSDRRWVNTVATTAFATYLDDPFVSNDDTPLAITGSGGVNKREDVLFSYSTIAVGPGIDANGSVSGIGTILPQDIPGVTGSGTNDVDSADGLFRVHVTGFTTSVDFNREDLLELGARGEFEKSTTFPIAVTTEITVTSASGDQVSATRDGLISGAGCNVGSNLTDRTIRLHMCEGLQLNIGKRNKLSGVSVAGGNTDGSNEELTYSYTNNNSLAVYHPQDPNKAVAGFDPTDKF